MKSVFKLLVFLLSFAIQINEEHTNVIAQLLPSYKIDGRQVSIVGEATNARKPGNHSPQNSKTLGHFNL